MGRGPTLLCASDSRAQFQPREKKIKKINKMLQITSGNEVSAGSARADIDGRYSARSRAVISHVRGDTNPHP